MKKYTAAFIFVFFLSPTAYSNADSVNQPAIHSLPADTVDLSIRFHHIEPHISKPGLVAHWTMDEGSGYQVMDQSGNGHMAYLIGEQWNTSDSGLTESFWRDGKRGGAVYLNGTQSLALNPETAHHFTESFMFSTWIRTDTGKADQREKTIVEQLESGQGFQLEILENDNLQLSVTGDRAPTIFKSSPDIIPSGDWFFVTIGYDKSENQAFLYLDGKEYEWQKHEVTSADLPEDGFSIGNAIDRGAGFRGWLDEVSLFNKSLSKSDIKDLHIVGLPKVYIQTRETVDPQKNTWTAFKGNQPVPHPADEYTALLLRFDGSAASKSGQKPVDEEVFPIHYEPGRFGGALNAASNGEVLTYSSPLTAASGTVEMWVIPEKATASDLNQQLVMIEGKEATLNVRAEDNYFSAELTSEDQESVRLKSDSIDTASSTTPIHFGITWGEGELILYVNGVEHSRTAYKGEIRFDEKFRIGGNSKHNTQLLIDDVHLSYIKRDSNNIGPRGHVDTESASLDLRDNFNSSGPALMHWQSSFSEQSWTITAKQWENEGGHSPKSGLRRQSLKQTRDTGFNTLHHTDAFGFNSSIEAGVSFDTLQSGWAGVFVQSPLDNLSETFSGYSFAIHPDESKIRLAIHHEGKIIKNKTLNYDFDVEKHKTYTLTLTSLDGILRGYIDGHNFISMNHSGDFTKGFSGVFTNNTTAWFDDIHFTALTPSTAASRRIERRIFYGSLLPEAGISYSNSSLEPFRWKKRYGLLPWERDFKKPEPPGNIFGPTQGVARPNPTRYWRSEDAANSDLITIDGTVYYFMRGNPDLNGPHGPAAIGVLTAQEVQFDGLHFNDPSIGKKAMDNGHILRGHKEENPLCTDNPKVLKRYQLNDEGTVYMNGKIWLFAKEFRHNYGDCPGFGRIVYGAYDLSKKRWVRNSPFEVDWSSVDPLSENPRRNGLYGTPEVTALREPETDEYVIYFYHKKKTEKGVETSGVVGLSYDGKTMKLHPDYPRKDTFVKPNHDNIYGKRILFDNGIYYTHVNAGSTKKKLKGDWPDRFQLYATLHPYEGPWTGSEINLDKQKTYFSRGGKYDPDNGAIWQGTMFKYKGNYYMYYENFHAINDMNIPYQNYNAVHTGSRVGFSTVN